MAKSKKSSKKSDTTTSSETSSTGSSTAELAFELDDSCRVPAIFVVGFETDVKEDFDKWMTIEPDGRLAPDSEKAKQSLIARKEKARQESALNEIYARLTNVSVWCWERAQPSGRLKRFSIRDFDDLEQLWGFFLPNKFEWASTRFSGIDEKESPVIYGFDSKLFCKLLANNYYTELVKGDHGSLSHRKIPLRFWKDNPCCFDPILDITGKSASSCKDLSFVLESFGLRWPGMEDREHYPVHGNANEDLASCFALMAAAQLIPMKV